MPSKKVVKGCFKLFRLALLLSFLWTDQVNAVPFPNSQAQDLEGDTIVIASEPDYPPYCIIDADGNPNGFSVELFKAAAKAVGFEVIINVGLWDDIMNDLAEGQINALPLVGRTPEREEIFDFTLPYISLHGAVFVRAGTEGINSLDELKGKEIVVMKGDNAEEFVRRINLSEKIITTSTFKEAFNLLESGRHDAVIMQRITGINLMAETGIKNIIPLDLYLPQFRQDFCFAVKKGDFVLLNRLNEGLSLIIADGTYEEIRLKWFGPGHPVELTAKDIFLMALRIFVPMLILMSAFWIVSLRKLVKLQTEKLNQEATKHMNTAELLRKQKLLLNEMEKVSRIGGWEYDSETGLLNWTEGVYLIFGIKMEEFTADNPSKYLKFVQNSDQSRFQKEFADCLNTGNSFDQELRIINKNGDTRWVRIQGHSETKEDAVSRVYGSIIDITEVKLIETELIEYKDRLEVIVEERTVELEEKVEKLNRNQKAMLLMVEDLNIVTNELKEERRKLEASNKELEAFTYSVSHDLRAPLRAINGFSGFLAEDYSDKIDDEGKRYLKTIRDNASRMDQLITDLLSLSRINKIDLKFSKVDMNILVNSVLNEVTPANELDDFEVIMHTLPKVVCDPVLVKQVWHNLIGNSVKYSSKSALKQIEIGSEVKDGEIVFSIKDKGAGFNPKFAGKLFTPFQRLHRESEYPGIGVGLAIVLRIVSRHGGKVFAKGEVGKGALFSFTIPENLNNKS